MLDDTGTPPEIMTPDNNGIDLVGYCEYLHYICRTEAIKIKDLEARLQKLEGK